MRIESGSERRGEGIVSQRWALLAPSLRPIWRTTTASSAGRAVRAVFCSTGLFLLILGLDMMTVQEVVKHGVRFVFDAGAECVTAPVYVPPERVGIDDESDGESDDAENDGSNPSDNSEHSYISASFNTAARSCHVARGPGPRAVRAAGWRHLTVDAAKAHARTTIAAQVRARVDEGDRRLLAMIRAGDLL